tara:strand:+ start:387 stop:758 length:372 start_codon:yes stop_codon:yes gene_type:complete
MYRSVILLLLLCGSVAAHDMRPTYPTWRISHVPDVKVTRMELFNKRADVEWYEIGVFDINFKPLPFVSRFRVLNIPYLTQVKFDVYVTEANSIGAEYICSISKLKASENNMPMVSSKICSRFK